MRKSLLTLGILTMIALAGNAYTADYLGLAGGGDSVVYQDAQNQICIGDDEADKMLHVVGDFQCIGIATDQYSTRTPSITMGSALNSMCTQNSTCYGNVIGGGGHYSSSAYANEIGSGTYYSVIAGGYNNVIDADADRSVISGGQNHLLSSGYAYQTIGGGTSNTTAGIAATIAGGYDNDALGYCSVGGGVGNVANSTYDTIGGGYYNYTSSYYSTVSGGRSNSATGQDSVVPGGFSNLASGSYSFAAGHDATADMNGAFVWSDSDSSCNASATDQFLVCADGGAYFSHNVSALSFTDRTPYPDVLETAYDAVMSMQRLPDGQYDPNDESMQLDHSSLTDFVYAEQPDGGDGRNLSATVSAQIEVIKDLVSRIEQLEGQVADCIAR